MEMIYRLLPSDGDRGGLVITPSGSPAHTRSVTVERVTERITPRQFHEAEGTGDWRVLFGGTCAHFRASSFAAGVALVDAIGKLPTPSAITPMSTCGMRA